MGVFQQTTFLSALIMMSTLTWEEEGNHDLTIRSWRSDAVTAWYQLSDCHFPPLSPTKPLQFCHKWVVINCLFKSKDTTFSPLVQIHQPHFALSLAHQRKRQLSSRLWWFTPSFLQKMFQWPAEDFQKSFWTSVKMSRRWTSEAIPLGQSYQCPLFRPSTCLLPTTKVRNLKDEVTVSNR